jgi:hypothetical protein
MLYRLAILWASPYTLLGLAIGLAGRGRMRRCGRVIQFHSGGVQWLIRKLLGEDILAITLGHVVLGQTAAALDLSHEHELVHVRQFERWGPLMGPAYLLCSLVLWLRGGRAYRDNPFEREAYGD